MTKHEGRMPKEFRSSNDEKYSVFVIRICFVIRHSDFVMARRCNFDRFGFALRPRFARMLLLLLLTVTRLRNGFSLAAAVSDKKCGDALPKCFLLWSLRAWLLKAPAPSPSSRATAPLALAS